MQDDSPKHLEKLIRDKIYAVCLVRGMTVEGDTAYAYVAVPMKRMEAFAVAQQSAHFVPADFGSILASGEGEPTPEVQQMMQENYGFNHAEAIVFS